VNDEVVPQKTDVVKPMSVEEALEVNKSLKRAESLKGGNDEENMLCSPDSDKSSDSQTGSSCSRKSDILTNKNGKPVKQSETGSSAKARGVHYRKHSKQNQTANLMQKCTDCFQHFFHELVTQKFIRVENLAETYFGSIVTSQSNCESYDSEDEDLFNNSDNCDRKIILENENEESLNTFSSACHLLVEFASFPMYGADTRLPRRQLSKGLFCNYFIQEDMFMI
jgi:hypothetical protein